MPNSIQTNRTAIKYTKREQALRVAWGGARILFRLSPRPFFGFRRLLLRLFGARVGKGVNVYPSSDIYFPWNLEIGDWSCIGERALIYNLGKVTIAQHVTISQGVHLCAGTHNYREASMPLLKIPITIESSVWVCADAFVGPGVTVGEGAILGARSVVVKDTLPWVIMAGNPAKMIKKREML